MRAWARIPLRTRVAAAFAASMAVALVVLGVFLHVRVAATLDEQVRTALGARADALQQLSEEQRDDTVRELTGETFGQVIGPDGSVRVSSGQLAGPVLDVDQLPDVGATTTIESQVFLETEDETAAVVLTAVRPTSETVVVGTATEDVAEVLEGLRAQLVLGGLAALLVASLAGYVVAGVALRPMERMRARAATISSRSSEDRLPLPEVHDEVHRLGSTLNDMLDRLDAGLRRERQFVAEAGHELRTPLAVLRTELDLAGSRPRSPDELTAFLASATEEVDRLADLVDRLLTLARADDSRLELEPEPVPVDELLGRVARRFSALAEPRTIRVEPGDPVSVTADRRRLDQAVSNLVDNAVRHGQGEIRLAAARDDEGDVVITVSDEGRDRPDESMWDRFRRGEGSRAGGRGLGLALVRAIVAEHGGEAWFDASAATTTVRLRLPA